MFAPRKLKTLIGLRLSQHIVACAQLWCLPIILLCRSWRRCGSQGAASPAKPSSSWATRPTWSVPGPSPSTVRNTLRLTSPSTVKTNTRVEWFLTEICYTFNVVTNCCRTPVSTFHVFILLFNLSQGLGKCWLLPLNQHTQFFKKHFVSLRQG